MELINKLYERAVEKDGKIVLPEATFDDRVMEACKILVEKKLCHIVLIGAKEQFSEELRNSEYVTIINCNYYNRITEMANLLMDIRKKDKLDMNKALDILREPRYFASMLVKMGEADGMVLGAYYTTADALRPALQIIKAKQNKRVIGSMILNRDDMREPYLFLDVSLNENPTAEELADMSIEAGKFYEDVLHRVAKIAFLSYSTHGSAQGELVDKMRTAANLAKSNPKYAVDGEIQFDAAIVPSVQQTKCPNSPLYGLANVFVFPDLNCGNIAYKIAQRLGNMTAIGPIMLNFNSPVNDLSRGCSVQDIVDTVVITKLQIEDKN